MIKIFEGIIDSLDAIYEKSKNPEIKDVSDALLRHGMILFNLFLADLLQINNNFCKFVRSRAMQFSSLPIKVERMKECLRKYMENIKTERSFFLDYADYYLHVAEQLLELSRSAQKRGLQKLKTEERKWSSLQKIARPFLKDFLAEIDVAFKKSDKVLCAFEVLNVDNLNKQQIDLINFI